MPKRPLIIIFLVFQVISFAGCGGDGADITANRIFIEEITLAGPAADPNAELSGLAWYDENLILLPQYPDRFAGATYGSLFYIPKNEIISFIDGDTVRPITPQGIDLDVADLYESIPDFEGFESIVFVGQTVYMTIECFGTPMKGVIISGTISEDLSVVSLDVSTLQEIPSGGSVPNASYESITYTGGKLLTFYEANGGNINPAPAAHVFSTNLETEPPVPFPAIEYRVTDATPADREGCFWIINYMYPGDAADYLPSVDSLRSISGVSPDPAGRVERLVELC